MDLITKTPKRSGPTKQNLYRMYEVYIFRPALERLSREVPNLRYSELLRAFVEFLQKETNQKKARELWDTPGLSEIDALSNPEILTERYRDAAIALLLLATKSAEAAGVRGSPRRKHLWLVMEENCGIPIIC